ncbi:RagB/SusD family nutrient uptake outer membrane protein [Pedobacter nyackensis]|uniref:RagB/SusD family nutrient uptake outer membrane protein n=1 Tax=Pedobacter nyackensis TaxID=475255 RepID=UPI00292D3CBF|nr:RagB/SusD family nutrient uptake outer membrane protein [Pedobacter nyackensis]
MKNRYIALLFMAIGIFSACNKFLDVKPKGIIIPEKVTDYEAILNSPTLTKTFPINLLDFADDNFNKPTALDQSPTANGYYWRPILTINEKASPEVWGPLYRAIYNTNVIINGVPKASGGTEAQKESVVAEALVIRASCYMTMLTVFAKSYNSATAATDPGLPWVTSINVTDKVPGRSTLKATLDAIINDVTTAVNGLPLSNVNRYRVTKYSAYGLLARVYLYMADFPNAKKYTDMALQAPHTLLNYNSYTDKNKLPVYDLNPEVLWQRSAVIGSPVFMLYSDDLKSYFNSSDIRYQFLTVTNNNGLGRSGLPGTYNFGITFPELYLTKAELLAREGKYNEAMDIVNTIRRNRIKTADYVDQSAANPEEALIKVFAERRRELAYSGTRWFDMKRFDQEGRMLEVKRINPTTQAVDASLPPRSPKYTFEIPVRVSMFNPDMELNHK